MNPLRQGRMKRQPGPDLLKVVHLPDPVPQDHTIQEVILAVQQEALQALLHVPEVDNLIMSIIFL